MRFYRSKIAFSIALLVLTFAWEADVQSDAMADPRNADELYDRVGRVDQLLAQAHALNLENGQKLAESRETRLSDTPHACQGRLTLTTGVPVTTTDVTAATSIRFTPYRGNRVAVYNTTSSLWEMLEFTEISRNTNPCTDNTNYDIFVYNNAGTLAIDTFVAWTSDTARNTALAVVDGVLVSNADNTRRYVGTFRCNAANQAVDSLTKRFLWNYYHRQPRFMRILEATNNWTYNSGAIRQVNASTANLVEYVLGFEESFLYTTSHLLMDGTVTDRHGITSCTEVDATTSCITDSLRGGSIADDYRQTMRSESNHFHAIGYHAVDWNEAVRNTTTSTNYGDDAADGRVQSGMTVMIWG